MAPRTPLREFYVTESKNHAFFTAGRLIWADDGKTLFSSSFGSINKVNIDTGKPEFLVGDLCENSDSIHCFTLIKDGLNLVTAHKSGLFKKWQTSDGQLLKQWKCIHKGIVTSLDSGNDVLISGGSDSVIRIWNVDYHTCSLALRGSVGIISIVKFYKVGEKDMLLSCADDLKISCWDLKTGDLLYQLSGHYSKITAIAFHYNINYLVSCGRDKVVMLWDLDKKCCIRAYPAFETLEDIVCLKEKIELPNGIQAQDGVYVAVAGEKGIIRIIEMISGHEIYRQKNSLVSEADQEGGLAITQLLYNNIKNSLAVATFDYNIIFYNISTFECEKQLVGFSDEILDITIVGPENSHFAVATNSRDIKLYNMSNMGCQLLKGHTNIVLSLCTSVVNNCFMISSAKDSTVRIWKFEMDTQTMQCLAVGSRHTSLVSSVCFSQLSLDFFVSVSKDTTLKLWSLKALKNELPRKEMFDIVVRNTEVAHEKEINSVTISPNDKLIATASQDKSIKLWFADGLAAVTTLKGHRRGVWCVRFSPVDQVLISSSADATIKLWSVAHFTCLKTFEGHNSSVLRAEFLSKGMQIVSSSADGLIKLWNIKDSECISTFDEHTGKIWALAVSADEENFLTGGSDSLLLLWRNATEERREAAFKAEEELRNKEQILSNLLHDKQLFSALSLSLSLDKPLTVLNIMRDILRAPEKENLRETIIKLEDIDKERLLKCVATWNTNSKNCEIAQFVLSVLLEEIVSGSLKVDNLAYYIEQLLPYTERHFKRLTAVLEDVNFLSYTLSLMKSA